MLPSLEEISKKRRLLGLTQKELARLSGVSQSLIAKLESRNTDSSYTKVKSIFDVLERLKIKEEVHVGEMPYNKVVGIQKNSKVSEAVWLMREHGYSQLPVFDGERVIGSISEKTILSQILTGKDLTQLSMLPVWDILDEAYPQVGEDTPRSLVSNLLQVYQAVLISRKGKILGIITKADLLRMLP